MPQQSILILVSNCTTFLDIHNIIVIHLAMYFIVRRKKKRGRFERVHPSSHPLIFRNNIHSRKRGHSGKACCLWPAAVCLWKRERTQQLYAEGDFHSVISSVGATNQIAPLPPTPIFMHKDELRVPPTWLITRIQSNRNNNDSYIDCVKCTKDCSFWGYFGQDIKNNMSHRPRPYYIRFLNEKSGFIPMQTAIN